MPISKENKKLYPANWKAISWQVRAEAGNQCEICDCQNGYPQRDTGAKVILTVHHLDFNPANNEPWNLIALCQRCHNRIDKRWRAKNRREKRDKEVESRNGIL